MSMRYADLPHAETQRARSPRTHPNVIPCRCTPPAWNLPGRAIERLWVGRIHGAWNRRGVIYWHRMCSDPTRVGIRSRKHEVGSVKCWGCRSITAYAICRFTSRGDTEGTEPTHPHLTSFHDHGRGISLGVPSDDCGWGEYMELGIVAVSFTGTACVQTPRVWGRAGIWPRFD
jgi:hypothetical protein